MVPGLTSLSYELPRTVSNTVLLLLTGLKIENVGLENVIWHIFLMVIGYLWTRN